MGAASSALAESQVEISRQAPPNLEQPNMRQAIDRVIPTDWLAQGGEGGEGGTGGFQDRLEASELIRELQKGGYVIFFRHAQTEVDFADQVFARMGHCATQRMLSEEGWQQARAIGQAFQALNIPVGQVFSSEYCRAWQTADLAFGRYEKVPGLNFAPAEEYTPAQVEQMRNGIMPLLTAVPARGTNTVIVGHDDVFEAATGIYPEPQGVAFVLKPNGQGGFDVIADINVNEWVNLSR
ncbi:histidine phosphatase family protein [bacterium]|nr:histidine phosphatase family protein [bacterium]